jgi:hypothetical protein
MNEGLSAPPLIVTASLPKDLQGYFDRLRRENFPPERNVLQAHVTLFHALPHFILDELRGTLASMTNGLAPVPAEIVGIMDLGGGTAFRIRSSGMDALRASLAEQFHGLLTKQDQAGVRLHVTVQNKVPTAQARALQAELATHFSPRSFSFAGLSVNRYVGGPWERAGQWRFHGTALSHT